MYSNQEKFIVFYLTVTMGLFGISLILFVIFPDISFFKFLIILGGVGWMILFPILIFIDLIVDFFAIFPFFIRSLKDNSGRLLFLSNIILMIITLYERFSFEDLLWIFWIQSFVIGIFIILRVKVMRFDESIDKSKEIFRLLGEFVLIQGIFVFGLFILDISISFEKAFIFLLFYVIAHGFSYIYNLENDKIIIYKQLKKLYNKSSSQQSRRLLKTSPRLWVMWFLTAIVIAVLGIIYVIPNDWNIYIYQLFAVQNIKMILILFFLIIKTIADGAAHQAYHEGKSIFGLPKTPSTSFSKSKNKKRK